MCAGREGGAHDRQAETSASNTRTKLSLLAVMMDVAPDAPRKMSMPFVMPMSLAVTRLLRQQGG